MLIERGDNLNNSISIDNKGSKLKKINNILDNNVELLEKMISKTEEFYGHISDKLPEIEEEIDGTIEETELLINYFIENNHRESRSANFKISEILENLQSRIAKVYEVLSSRFEVTHSLEGFINKSDDEQAEFVKLLNLIQELEEVLNDLEILSINAIIFSAKTGREGAGFRVISNKIKQLTSNIKDKYQLIQVSILELQKWYKSFEGDLEELTSSEEEVANNYSLESQEIFSAVLDSLSGISKLLKDFMDHIKEVVEPIYDIIILLQNQDIIRQNLENLIEITQSMKEEIDKLNSNDSIDENLDILIFLNEVSNLSKKLSSNILKQLDDSLFEINNKFNKINSDLIGLEKDGEEITSFLIEDNNKEEKKDMISIERIYENLDEFINKLGKKLTKIEGRYYSLAKNEGDFYDNMKAIEESFYETNNIANQFTKIKFLAKIEFSRITNNKHSFVTDIESIIEQFIASSNHNDELYHELKEELEDNYSHFIELAMNNQKLIKKSNQLIGQSKEDLFLTKKLIKEAVQGLNKAINRLFLEVKGVNKEIGDCFTLREVGEEVIKSLETIQREVVEIKDYYLAKIGKSNWNSNNEKLEKLLDKFTSYIERKTAQDEMVDLEVDVGSAGGELTLF